MSYDHTASVVPFPRRHSPNLTEEMAEEIRKFRRLGMMQHDIAAYLKVNQGRVSEVLTGKRFPPKAPELFDRPL